MWLLRQQPRREPHRYQAGLVGWDCPGSPVGYGSRALRVSAELTHAWWRTAEESWPDTNVISRLGTISGDRKTVNVHPQLFDAVTPTIDTMVTNPGRPKRRFGSEGEWGPRLGRRTRSA